MLTPPNVATPATAFDVIGPASVPPAGFAPNASDTAPVNVVATLFCASRAVTVITPSDAPASAELGPVVKTNCVATVDEAVALNVTGLAASPAAVAVNVCAPAAGPSVQFVDASPLELVATLDALTLPPFAGTKVTATPATPEASLAVTRTETAVGSTEPAGPLCALPEVTAIAAAGSVVVTIVESAGPVRSDAITVAVPRRTNVVAVPTRALANRTNVLSVLVNTIGASSTALPCPSNACAVKVRGDPPNAVADVGRRSTRVACAPGPT